MSHFVFSVYVAGMDITNKILFFSRRVISSSIQDHNRGGDVKHAMTKKTMEHMLLLLRGAACERDQ